MNQQRSRRFRTAQEAKEKDAEKAELIILQKRQGTYVETGEPPKKTWDSNAITPGTPFMNYLAASLRYWCAYKLNTDPAWENRKVIISDASVPGEGEHKIMEFIRSQRSSPHHDPNTRHVIYGLDADLIMLGIATHEPHFRVLREDVFFQQGNGRNCHTCGQPGHIAADCKGKPKEKSSAMDKPIGEKPFIWLHVAALREYLAIEMHPPNQAFAFDLERALDDWVFMCFFVGNDFLPHLPSLEIRDQGIDTLIAIWRDNSSTMGGYVTKDGHVDLKRAEIILEGLAKQEDAIFKKRKEVEDKKERNAQRRKQEEEARNNRGGPPKKRQNTGKFADDTGTPTEAPADLRPIGEGAVQKNNITYDMVVNGARPISETTDANKSAAQKLKEMMKFRAPSNASWKGSDPSSANGEGGDSVPSTNGKRKADEVDEEEGTPGRDSPKPKPETAAKGTDAAPEDDVRMWESGYADRYYEQKFHVDKNDVDFRRKVARHYVEGLAWVLLYYFQGCPSWTWYYPYHYAPFAADFKGIGDMEIKFEKGRIFKPYEQLMGVMPATSRHTIPSVFHSLMTDEESAIKEFYPEDFVLDLNGKKFAWQGVALLPFIDEKRLLDAMATRYPELTEDEHARNEPGKEALLFSDKHPLAASIIERFYSKKKSEGKFMIDSKDSEGLAGEAEKNEDFLPSQTLIFAANPDAMPQIDEDRSLTVHYYFPESKSIHKSMLLRGLKMPTPALDGQDIAEAQDRAMKTGRTFGGAPLRSGSFRGGRGGGRMDYGQNNGHSGRGGGGRGGGGGHRSGGYNSGGGNAAYGSQHQQQQYPAAPANFDPRMFPGGVPPPPHLAMQQGFVPPPPPGMAFQPGGFPGYPPPPNPYGGFAPPPQHQGYANGHGAYGGGGQGGRGGGYGGGGGGQWPPAQGQGRRY